MAQVQELLICGANRLQLPAILLSAVSIAGCGSGSEVVDTTIKQETELSTEPATKVTLESPTRLAGENSANSQGRTTSFDRTQEQLVGRYQNVDANCRGGSGDSARTWHACAKRDALSPEMRKSNLCYGLEGDEGAFQAEWHICNPGSLGYSIKAEPISQGRCKILADGKKVYEGNCLMNLQEGGSFWVMDLNQRAFASVERYGDTAEALVNVDGQAYANDGQLGSVQRKGACWGNANVEICAWG